MHHIFGVLFIFMELIMKKILIAGVVAFGMTISAQAKDIVETAVAAGSFKTLATALGAAGLVDTLKGKGPFTVFAPTDDAFNALPAGTVAALRLLLVSVTTNPFGPARPVSLIVIVLLVPPLTDVGFRVTVDTAAA